MLELLASPLLVSIRNCLVINIGHIWESVHNKSPHHACLRHLILLNVQTSKSCQRFQFRNLNKTVNVIIHKEERFKFVESPQLADIRWRNDVVETYVLEGNLLHSLLEVRII